MLETYDPKWQEKWDRANARLKALNDKPFGEKTSADWAEQNNLASLLCRISEAGARTANDLIDLYAPYFLLPAKRHGLIIEVPRLPDDTGYDEASAVLREFQRRVEAAVLEAATKAEAKADPAEPSDPPRTVARPMPVFARRPTWWEKLRAHWLAGFHAPNPDGPSPIGELDMSKAHPR